MPSSKGPTDNRRAAAKAMADRTPQPSEQPRRDALELLASLVNRDIEAQFEELYGATLDSALFEAEAAAPDPVASPAEALRAALERLAHYADAAATCFYPQEGKERCDHRPILRDEVARARRYLEGAVASPAPLDVERLARALHATRGTGPPIDWDDPNCDCPEDARAIAAAYALTGQPVADSTEVGT